MSFYYNIVFATFFLDKTVYLKKKKKKLAIITLYSYLFPIKEVKSASHFDNIAITGKIFRSSYNRNK